MSHCLHCYTGNLSTIWKKYMYSNFRSGFVEQALAMFIWCKCIARRIRWITTYHMERVAAVSSKSDFCHDNICEPHTTFAAYVRILYHCHTPFRWFNARKTSALAMELRLPCINPSICSTENKIFAICNTGYIALKPPVWRSPSAFCEMGVQQNFPPNLLSCGWMWLASSMGRYLFAWGLTCVCLVLGGFLSLKRGARTNTIFHYFPSIIWRIQQKRTDLCRFKTWMEFARQMLMKLEMSSIQVFLKSSEALWRVINANMWWPLREYSSMHSRWEELCGSAALWLTAGVHATNKPDRSYRRWFSAQVVGTILILSFIFDRVSWQICTIRLRNGLAPNNNN